MEINSSVKESEWECVGVLILLRLAFDKGTELRLYRTRSRQGYSERRVRCKEGTVGVKVLV